MNGIESMDGFYKVAQSGGSYVTATFFNPDTKEIKSYCVRDYDYSDCSRDRDDLYYMPIDKEVQRVYLHNNGMILEGDIVEVVKGRKMPIGYTGRVETIEPYYDRYGRWCADYIYFADGNRTNIQNCKLVEAV